MTEGVKWYGKEFEAELDKIIKKKLLALVYRLERIIQELFRAAKSGRIYKRGGKAHQAAGPGEAPAIDSGATSKSVTHSNPAKIGDVWSIDAGISEQGGRAEIVEFQEFGASKMPAHPVFRPALAMLQHEVDAAMRERE